MFSISALDLFASGMGAFVLLTIIAIPFFPNTGDSEVRVEELARELEASEIRVRDLEGLVSRFRQESAMQDAVDALALEAQQNLKSIQGRISELEQALTHESDSAYVASLRQELVEHTKALLGVQERAASLELTSRELKLPPLDVVICLDVTGSMYNQVEGLKREINSLARVLDKVAPSVGIGIVAFGDRRWKQPIHLLNVVETAHLNSITSFVNRLSVGMDPNQRLNTDGPEAAEAALGEAVAMPWREDSAKRYVILITDNAAYPERVSAAVETARKFGSQPGQHVSTVRANIVYDSAARNAAVHFLKEVAHAGGGSFVDAAGGESMLGSILLAILGT